MIDELLFYKDVCCWFFLDFYVAKMAAWWADKGIRICFLFHNKFYMDKVLSG